MCLHPWKDPEINQIQTQNQGKQDEWPKETQEKYPIKGIQTPVRAFFSWAEERSMIPWMKASEPSILTLWLFCDYSNCFFNWLLGIYFSLISTSLYFCFLPCVVFTLSFFDSPKLTQKCEIYVNCQFLENKFFWDKILLR